MKRPVFSPGMFAHFVCMAVSLAWLFLWACSARAQAPPAAPPSPDAIFQELNETYRGLLPAIGHLLSRLQNDIQYPPQRSESHILPLLPESTVMYLALPNYGDAAHQAAQILREEMKQSAVLRDWVEKNGEWASFEPKIENSLDKLFELHHFFGDEIVLSGAMAGGAPAMLAVAEIRRPGLKEFLQKNFPDINGGAKAGVRIFDPQELAAADAQSHANDLLVLLRPDLVVASSDLVALRAFNARIDQRSEKATAFKERLGQEYPRGLTVLAGADLHRIFAQLPPIAQRDISSVQRSGFGDAKYLIWDRSKGANEQGTSQAELSFMAPRRGAAAWLAISRRLTTLDFVSPQAMLALTIVLRDPAQVFDDIRVMARLTNPNAFAALAQFENMVKLTVKDDVLANLDGEFTLELDRLAPNPAWRVIFKVKEAGHLQQTFNTLLAATPFPPHHSEQGGVAFTSIEIPRGKEAPLPGPAPAPLEIAYAFVDNRLIIGSGRNSVAEAVRLHQAGESLEKSQRLQAELPPGHSLEASALFFQDPVAMWSLQLRRFAPELVDSAANLIGQKTPSVAGVYADDTTIREAHRSSGMDVATSLIVAAVAIPNLLRSGMVANEASAVGSVRTIVVAQVTYSVAYPKRVYAPNLATLGPDPRGAAQPSPEHADLVHESLSTENCTADGWCTKSGYRLKLNSLCRQSVCSDYVVVAVPVSNNTDSRSFCSASDGIIRFKLGGQPLSSPLSVAECKKWEPLR